MRSLVLLSLLGAAAADTGDCLVDSGEAVSDAVDASLFIWAAAKRCGKTGMEIKCEVDITSAVKATNGMINVILKAVDKCDGLHTANKECGLEAGVLTKHVSGLAAASGIVAQKCPKNVKEPPAFGDIAAPVMCTVDLKNTLKQLFKAVSAIRKSQERCEEEDKRFCAASAMDIVSSFSAMGGYLAGAVGQCRRTNPKVKDGDTRTELCTQAVTDLVHHTMEVAESGTKMSQKCSAESAATAGRGVGTVELANYAGRLYESPNLRAASTSSSSIVLAAFLPVAAIVGFLGGRVYGTHRPARDVVPMSDNEMQ